MNPRDEKIITAIHKKQNSDYDNYVPFSIIQRSFLWIDATELTMDLLNLSEQGYLYAKNLPTESSGFWYTLTSKGNREYERIKHANNEAKKNRNIQLISAIVGVIIGFLLNEFF